MEPEPIVLEPAVDPVTLLGPLRPLVGIWEGAAGDDTAPGDDRGTEKNYFRERIVVTPIGRVDNHEQIMHGVSYAKRAWRLGHADAFHEEMGYLLWDPGRSQVIKCFLVPRGIAVVAGGTVAADATTFRLTATLGSPTYGICSNQFLDEEFKTTAYEITYVTGGATLGYDETTTIQIKGKPAPFAHRDFHTLNRAPA